MSRRSGPRSWVDSLLAVCLTLLAGSIALHLAVSFIAQDWPWLAGIALAGVVVAAAVMLVRSRHRGW